MNDRYMGTLLQQRTSADQGKTYAVVGEIAQRTGLTKADVLRTALRSYCEREHPDLTDEIQIREKPTPLREENARLKAELAELRAKLNGAA